MVDVINPNESTDPLQVSEGRELPAPPVQQRDASQEIPTLPPQSPAPPNTQRIVLPPQLRNIDPNQGTNMEQQGDGAPANTPMFQSPTFRHPQLRYPTINPALAAGPDIAESIDEIMNNPVSQLNALQLVGDPIAQTQNLANMGSNFVRSEPDIEHYRRRVLDTNTVASRRAAAIQSAVTPPGEGIAGPNAFIRNVMAGKPFHPVTEDGVSGRDVVAGAGRGIVDLVKLTRDYIQFTWQETMRDIDTTNRDTFMEHSNTARRQRNSILRGLAADITAGWMRIFTQNPLVPDEVKQARRNVVERIRGPREFQGGVTETLQFNPMLTPEQQQEILLSQPVEQNRLIRFANQSPTFRAMLEQLEPEVNDDGEALFNPLRGQFGDFGNAGALSALLYLANIPEGLLTGGLYELTNLLGDGYATIRNQPRTEVQAQTRPGIAAAFLGRDLGIMQRYRESSYLSFVGNPALEWVPRKGQWYAGFLADMAIGGIADAPLDALLRTRRQAIRQARRAIPPNLTPPPTTTLTDVADTGLRTIQPDTPLDVINRVANNVQPSSNISTFESYVRRTLSTPVEVTDSVALVPLRNLPDTPIPEVSEVTRLTQQIDNVQLRSLPAQTNVRQAFANNVATIHSMQRSLRDNYQDVAGAIVRQSGAEVNDGLITNSTPVLDAVIPTVPYSVMTPGFAQYSDALDLYRTTPNVDPSALEFVRRTDEQLIALAQRYGILEPDEQMVSSMRLHAMQELYPELLSAWGKHVGDDITAPTIRLLSPADTVQDVPETSIVVDSPPVLRAINPDGDESLQSIFRRFDRFVDERSYLNETDNNPISLDARRQARDTVRDAMRPVIDRLRGVTNIDNARARRELSKIERQINNLDPTDLRRFDELEAQAQQILDDNPNLTDDIRRASLPPNINPDDADDIISNRPVVIREGEIGSNLRNQLDGVRRRVEEQEDLLSQHPPLEREFPTTESVTRQSFGNDNVIDINRGRTAPPDTTNVLDFPARFNERNAPEQVTPQQRQRLDEIRRAPEPVDFNRQMVRETIEDINEDVVSVSRLREEMPGLNPAQQERMIMDTLDSTPDDYELVIVRSHEDMEGVPENVLRDAVFNEDGDVIIGIRKARQQADELPAEFDDIRGNFIDDIVPPGMDNDTALRKLRELRDAGAVRLTPWEDPDEVRGRRIISDGPIDEAWASRYAFMKIFDERAVRDAFDIQPRTAFEPQFYHGTKGRVSRFSNIPSASLSNELGPGLYLTPDIELARNYSRAMPSKDKVAYNIGHRTTEQGRIYPVRVMDGARTLDVDVERDTWRGLVRDNINDPEIRRLFKIWSQPGKKQDGHQFLHYVRSQFIKRRGKDAFAEPYREFVDDLNFALRDNNIDVLKYGDTLNVINNNALRFGRAIEDSASTNTITEGLLSRYAVDLDMHSRLDNATTKAILDDDRLDIDVNLMQKLEEAVGTQESATLDGMRALMKQEDLATQTNIRRLQQDVDDLYRQKLDNFEARNRNIIHNQGDDCF